MSDNDNDDTVSGSVFDLISQEQENQEQIEELVSNDGFLAQRGTNQKATTIVFKLPEQSTSMPYSYLRRSDVTKKGGIKLQFAGTNIVIKGKNLLPLFESISRQKAFFIEQHNPKYHQEKDRETWIDEIIISEPM